MTDVNVSSAAVIVVEDNFSANISPLGIPRGVKKSLEDAIEGLRDRYGKRAITYATLLGDLKMPDDGRHSVKMPGLMYQ